MATPEEIRAKLAAARAAQAARDDAAAAEADAAELELFELVEKFEKELGREGRAFAVVDATDLGEGHIVLRLGEGVLWKTYAASKMNVVDTDAFVLPCVVHPTKEVYREIVMRRGFIADRCANALATLYGVKVGETRKK